MGKCGVAAESDADVLVTEDTEKARLLNVSVFSAEVGNPRLWK